MSRLKSEKVSFRGEDFLVTEWTPAQRVACVKERDNNPYTFRVAIVFNCAKKPDGSAAFESVEKIMTEEPCELIDFLMEKIAPLIGWKQEDDDEKKD